MRVISGRWQGQTYPRLNRSHPLASRILWGLIPYQDRLFSIDSGAQVGITELAGNVNVTTSPQIADPVWGGYPVLESNGSAGSWTNLVPADFRLRLDANAFGSPYCVVFRFIEYSPPGSSFSRILDCSNGGSGAGGWSIYIDGQGTIASRRAGIGQSVTVVAPQNTWYDVIFYPRSLVQFTAYLKAATHDGYETIDQSTAAFGEAVTGQPNFGVLNSCASWSQTHPLNGALAWAYAFTIEDGVFDQTVLTTLFDAVRMDPYFLIAPPIWNIEESVPAPSGLEPEPVTLAWSSTEADVTSTVTLDAASATLAWSATEAPIGLALDLDTVAFAFSSSEPALDVFVEFDGEDFAFNWTSSNAGVVLETAELDADPVSLGWTAADCDVVPAGVLALETVTLGWSATDSGIVSEEQTLDVDNALLQFTSSNAGVIDELNLVSGDPVAFAWTADEAGIVNEQVTGEPLTLGWTAGNVNLFVEVDVTHAHLVNVIRPDSLDVEVFSSDRVTRFNTT